MFWLMISVGIVVFIGECLIDWLIPEPKPPQTPAGRARAYRDAQIAFIQRRKSEAVARRTNENRRRRIQYLLKLDQPKQEEQK